MLLSLSIKDIIGIIIVIIAIILFIKSIKAWVLSRIIGIIAIIANIICLLINSNLNIMFFYISFLYTFGVMMFEVSTERREYDLDDFIPSDIQNVRFSARNDNIKVAGDVKSYGIVSFIVIGIIASFIYFGAAFWVRYILAGIILLIDAICLISYYR